jgi:glycine/D-amino acid oxidase-like deaminating enzyme
VLFPDTPATGFEVGPQGVEGVQTPFGTIATRAVVDAAGAWARLVAAGLGASPLANGSFETGNFTGFFRCLSL